VQPVDQRADRRVVVGVQQRRVVEGADQLAAAHELLPQQLVVDVEPQRLGRRIEVRSVDEQRQPFVSVEHNQSLRNKAKVRLPPLAMREWRMDGSTATD
jgi:hypothetical protein